MFPFYDISSSEIQEFTVFCVQAPTGSWCILLCCVALVQGWPNHGPGGDIPLQVLLLQGLDEGFNWFS